MNCSSSKHNTVNSVIVTIRPLAIDSLVRVRQQLFFAESEILGTLFLVRYGGKMRRRRRFFRGVAKKHPQVDFVGFFFCSNIPR